MKLKFNFDPVKIVENALKEVGKGAKNVLNETAIGVRNVGDQLQRDVSNVSNFTNAGLGNMGSYIERSGAEMVENLGYGIKTGDWTPFVNRTLSGGALFSETMGAAKGTDSARTKIKQAAGAAEQQAIADAAAANEAARLSAINEFIAQQVETRRRSPGKSQTIMTGLDGSGTGGTLLTRRG